MEQLGFRRNRAQQPAKERSIESEGGRKRRSGIYWQGALKRRKTRASCLWSVRDEVFYGTALKITDTWDVTPCSVADMYRSFRGVCCFHLQGKKQLTLNVVIYLPDYTASRPGGLAFMCVYVCVCMCVCLYVCMYIYTPI